jgi:hypothetical protein
MATAKSEFMIAVTGVSSLLWVFMSIWCLNMMRRPRYWRSWWLIRIGHFSHFENRNSRTEVRAQDRFFRKLALVACVMSLLLGCFSAGWTWWQLRELRYSQVQTR